MALTPPPHASVPLGPRPEIAMLLRACRARVAERLRSAVSGHRKRPPRSSAHLGRCALTVHLVRRRHFVRSHS